MKTIFNSKFVLMTTLMFLAAAQESWANISHSQYCFIYTQKSGADLKDPKNSLFVKFKDIISYQFAPVQTQGVIPDTTEISNNKIIVSILAKNKIDPKDRNNSHLVLALDGDLAHQEPRMEKWTTCPGTNNYIQGQKSWYKTEVTSKVDKIDPRSARRIQSAIGLRLKVGSEVPLTCYFVRQEGQENCGHFGGGLSTM